MKLKIAICDNEQQYCKILQTNLIEYCENHLIDASYFVFDDSVAFMEDIRNGMEYDIVFLDIDMPIINGITLAREVKARRKSTYIAFVTAFISYAPEGFKVDAIRYMLKNHEGFSDSICECMDAVTSKLSDHKNMLKIPFVGGCKSVVIEDILYVESRLHRLEFHIEGQDGVFWTYDKMDLYEERLKYYGFIRIHQSYLINAKYIQLFYKSELKLVTGEKFTVPKGKLRIVRERYTAYKGEF